MIKNQMEWTWLWRCAHFCQSIFVCQLRVGGLPTRLHFSTRHLVLFCKRPSHRRPAEKKNEFKLNIFVELIKWFMHLFNPFGVAQFWCEYIYVRARAYHSQFTVFHSPDHSHLLFAQKQNKKNQRFSFAFLIILWAHSVDLRPCCYVPLETKGTSQERDRQRQNPHMNELIKYLDMHSQCFWETHFKTNSTQTDCGAPNTYLHKYIRNSPVPK